MTKREIINQELCAAHLADLDIEDTDSLGAAGPTLSQSVATPVARALCASLVARGVDADWAPDGDDASQAWIYVCANRTDLDETVA